MNNLTIDHAAQAQTLIININNMSDIIGRKRLGFGWLFNLSLFELRRIQDELINEYNKHIEEVSK